MTWLKDRVDFARAVFMACSYLLKGCVSPFCQLFLPKATKQSDSTRTLRIRAQHGTSSGLTSCDAHARARKREKPPSRTCEADTPLGPLCLWHLANYLSMCAYPVRVCMHTRRLAAWRNSRINVDCFLCAWNTDKAHGKSSTVNGSDALIDTNMALDQRLIIQRFGFLSGLV